MTSNVSTVDYRRLILALIYIYVPLILYPTLLLVIQDGANLSKVNVGHYFSPLQLSHLKSEMLFVGLGFIFTYIVVAGIAFVREARIIFVIFATIIAYLMYEFGIYLYAAYFGTGYSGTLSAFDHGWIMVIAIAFGIYYSESLIFHIFGYDALRLRPGRARAPDFILHMGWLILLPMVGYPILMILVEAFPNVSDVRVSRIFETTQAPLFSYETQLITLASLLIYSGVFTLVFVKTKRGYFFVAVSAVAYLLYNFGMNCQIFVDRSVSAFHMRSSECNSNDLSACLLFAEHGWIFTASFIFSTVIVERLFKYLGKFDLYDVSR